MVNTPIHAGRLINKRIHADFSDVFINIEELMEDFYIEYTSSNCYDFIVDVMEMYLKAAERGTASAAIDTVAVHNIFCIYFGNTPGSKQQVGIMVQSLIIEMADIFKLLGVYRVYDYRILGNVVRVDSLAKTTLRNVA